MRILFALLLASSSAYADVLRLHDSDGTTPQGKFDWQAGVTCSYYNSAASIPWENLGGDWVDVNGIAQGSTPIAAAPFVGMGTTAQTIQIDATALLNLSGIVIRRSGTGSISIASRESAAPPELRLTMLDGSVVTQIPDADSSLHFLSTGGCQSTPTGKNIKLTVEKNIGVMAFPPPPDGVVSAKLVLTLTASSGRGSIDVYGLRVPYPDSVSGAIAISPEPGVYYDEPWESDDWYNRNGDSRQPDYLWTQDNGRFHREHTGLWIADGSEEPVPAQGTDPVVLLPRGSGYQGRGLAIIYAPNWVGSGVGVPSAYITNLLGREQEEAWLTYRIRYGQDFVGFLGCEGGKAPGLAGNTSACGNSGSPGNGFCGWSMRMSYKLICDQTNPAFGRIRLYMYAYHGLMTGFYGDTWHGNANGLLELDRWYCIEQYVKVNTPGVADGIAQFYVDGNVALDRRDVYLRAEKPASGYGVWTRVTTTKPAPDGAVVVTDNFGRSWWHSGRTVDTELGIDRAWMVVHNGGKRAPGKVAQMWLDEIKVSHRRVGCNPTE